MAVVVEEAWKDGARDESLSHVSQQQIHLEWCVTYWTAAVVALCVCVCVGQELVTGLGCTYERRCSQEPGSD